MSAPPDPITPRMIPPVSPPNAPLTQSALNTIEQIRTTQHGTATMVGSALYSPSIPTFQTIPRGSTPSVMGPAYGPDGQGPVQDPGSAEAQEKEAKGKTHTKIVVFFRGGKGGIS